jgi:hypothetical protein
MSKSGEFTQLVRAAEKKLLSAIAVAANSGNLEWIDRLRSAIRELRATSAVHVESSDYPRTGRPRVAGESRETGPAGTSLRYPRFLARRGTLYRVAWSRKTKSEYEHKVPKDNVTAIVQAMAAAADAGVEPVTVDAILARVNRMNAVQVPQYQVYLVIGWLRYAKHIEQVGRDGYRIPRDIVRIAEENWRELLIRAG